MGLPEKRALEAFKTAEFTALQTSINAITGGKVEWDIHWDTLMQDGMVEYFKDAATKIYFTPLLAALQAVCIDDMGKKAVAGALKKIVIKSDSGSYHGGNYTFENGVLDLTHDSNSNIDAVDERKTYIQTLLESKL